MNIPNGLKGIIEFYGEAKDAKIVEVPFPFPVGKLTHIHVHEMIEDALRAAWAEIFDGGNWGTLHDCGGGYCYRTIRGNPDHLSTHAWGIAVDFNTASNPLGEDHEATYEPGRPFLFTADHPVVVAFKNQGALWGGEFKHRKDPMHFQFCTGY